MDLTFKRLGAFAFALCCVAASLPAKVERTTVYMFGFSASFTDSVAYITDVQQLDSAYIETKSDFLMDRAVYSDQLQTYLEAMTGMQNSTCAVFFGTKKSKLLGEYNKIKKRYMTDSGVVLKTLEPEAFRFQSPQYEPRSVELPAAEPPAPEPRPAGGKPEFGPQKQDR